MNLTEFSLHQKKSLPAAADIEGGSIYFIKPDGVSTASIYIFDKNKKRVTLKDPTLGYGIFRNPIAREDAIVCEADTWTDVPLAFQGVTGFENDFKEAPEGFENWISQDGKFAGDRPGDSFIIRLSISTSQTAASTRGVFDIDIGTLQAPIFILKEEPIALGDDTAIDESTIILIDQYTLATYIVNKGAFKVKFKNRTFLYDIVAKVQKTHSGHGGYL